jgi:ABC-type antimicrobial peptide transport system permease subunit
VFERHREFGLLQALGMRPWLIVMQVTLESALLVGTGIVVGVVITFLTLAPFRDGLDLGFLAEGAEVYGAGHILHPAFNIADAAQSCLVIWILGIAASLWPARTAAHADPVAAMNQL